MECFKTHHLPGLGAAGGKNSGASSFFGVVPFSYPNLHCRTRSLNLTSGPVEKAKRLPSKLESVHALKSLPK